MRRGSTTKSGNAHACRVLVEAAGATATTRDRHHPPADGARPAS
jgi:hypothetical protein